MKIRIRQGIAPCRRAAAALPPPDLFLIFADAKLKKTLLALRSREGRYFLNKLSKAARASLALRGAEPFSYTRGGPAIPLAGASRATVTRAENSSHSFA
jgi:hypothetical protein